MHQFFLAEHRELLHFLDDGADVANRLDDIARAGFALGADHGRAFGDAAQGLAQIARAADERNFVIVLVDVMLFVGGREHFAFVDVIDAQRFEDARFGEVADAHLGHHRDGDGGHDVANDADLGHAGHAALFADIGRHAFQRHHRASARLLGDHGLLGIDDVHDDAALQHLSQTHFEAELVIQKVHCVVLLRLETKNR